MNEVYANPLEVEAVVTGFETCTTAKEAFSHADHLTVAVSYLSHFSAEDAITNMRDSLFRFIDHHGVPRQKYHETLTVFWIEITESTLKQRPDLETLVDKCNFVRRELANKDVVNEFYSKELLFSDKAREQFIEPDLKTWRIE